MKYERRSENGGVWQLVALTLSNVCLQTLSAILVKTATIPATVGIVSMVLLAVVLALNVGRFLLWNAIHKRYDLSVAYPASALFFPCIVVASALFGEPLDRWKILGAALVTMGVVVLMFNARSKMNGR